MKQNLNITIIQSNLVWENALQNRLNFEEKISLLKNNTDIVVLPEMFTTGFSMHPKLLAETMNGETVTWMKLLAAKTQIAICGSIIIKEDESYYNRFLFIEPSGNIHQYDKRHLFTLAGEHLEYKGGNKKIIISYNDWKICPLVCYDLRFPVWARNKEDYDVLLYVANWPKQRITAWNTLLNARAIENMCYTIGVNRVGMDPNNNEYSGSSKAFDYLGNELATIPLNTEQTITVKLDKKAQNLAREKFNFLNDKDTFEIK